MKPERKAARERCKGLRTAEELRDLLASLNVTDEEREMAFLILSKGWSYTRVGMEFGLSRGQIDRRMRRVYSKLC